MTLSLMAVFLLCECSASFALAPVGPDPLILTLIFCASAVKSRLASLSFAFIRVSEVITFPSIVGQLPIVG